jgi:hypothetical protein
MVGFCETPAIIPVAPEIIEQGQSVNIFQHIIRGCGTLSQGGEHPGTVPLIGFSLLGGLAGYQSAEHWIGFAFGFTVTLLIYGPLYLYGAYSRSKYEERHPR